MRKIYFAGWIIWIALTAYACHDKLMYDTAQKRSIYFEREKKNNPVHFSFISEEGDTFDYAIPLKTVGMPVASEQTASVTVVADSSTAKEGVHYRITEPVIASGAVTAQLIVTLFRTPDMLNKPFVLYLRFEENDYFKPMDADDFVLHITDGEYTRPKWWKDADLGNFSSGLFKRILEKYWELEEIRPVEYLFFEEEYGRLLENAPDWFWSGTYKTIWVKYVLKPVWEYYQENPTEGVNMVNPDKHVS